MNEHAPGWYEHEGERRYWDGSQWTHATSTPPRTYAPTPPLVTGQVVPYSGESPPYTPPPAVPLARKEPAIALLVSFFIPGVGSMMNGDVGAGVGFLLLYGFGLVLVVCLGWIVIGLIGIPFMLLAWAWSMYHAYQGAIDFNRRAGHQG